MIFAIVSYSHKICKNGSAVKTVATGTIEVWVHLSIRLAHWHAYNSSLR